MRLKMLFASFSFFPLKRKHYILSVSFSICDARNFIMTEISLNCLPVGMTSVGKNVYPVANTLDESDDKGNDVTTENFEGKY